MQRGGRSRVSTRPPRRQAGLINDDEKSMGVPCTIIGSVVAGLQGSTDMSGDDNPSKHVPDLIAYVPM
jgi:hypothetical protein